ncbi:hypothetical protein L7F22_018842 [Adiantum nelumboides]|nr:hypothetical protein [Adiantum nelumboides]
MEDSVKWEQAMQLEYNSIIANETWELTELPQGKQPYLAKAEHFTEVEFARGNKCQEQNSKVLVHDEKEDVLDKEVEPDAKVEIVGGYNCKEQDPKVEVHVEKEAVLEKYSPENGDQAKSFPSSMKNNEVSARDTSPSILQTIQMMQRERKRKMTVVIFGKDAATSNIDNHDHIVSMIAKSTTKDPLDVDTSFRVEGQVPCASNIEDQEVKNTKFVVLSTTEDTEIIMKKFEPREENDDASVDAGGDASCAGVGDDTEIIIDKYEPPWEAGDASVDAGGADGAVGAGEDTEMIIEKYKPSLGDGDASVDAGGDGSCAIGAEYVRHDDGTVSWQREDGGGVGGVAGYVRNDDGMVSRPWEDLGNLLFERLALCRRAASKGAWVGGPFRHRCGMASSEGRACNLLFGTMAPRGPPVATQGTGLCIWKGCNVYTCGRATGVEQGVDTCHFEKGLLHRHHDCGKALADL